MWLAGWHVCSPPPLTSGNASATIDYMRTPQAEKVGDEGSERQGLEESSFSELERTPAVAAVSRVSQTGVGHVSTPDSFANPVKQTGNWSCPFPRLRSYPGCFEDCPDVSICHIRKNALPYPSALPGYVHYASPREAIFDNEDWAKVACSSMHRIVGWHTLKGLLQPAHPFFANHRAYLRDFSAYQVREGEKYLLYPRICAPTGERLSRLNPYRQHQLARSHTARITRTIFALIDQYRLSGFSIACLVFTFPTELSVFLSSHPHGTQLAWRLWHKMWSWYAAHFVPSGAASVNLHTWKTESPLDPHYHFHAIVPNYGLTQANCEDEDGAPALAFQRSIWHRQRSGTTVPLSDEDLLAVKNFWYALLAKFCKKHLVDVPSFMKSVGGVPPVDIFIDFVRLSDQLGTAKFMHKLNYQQRRPIEDYAKWSNQHPDAPSPSAQFCRYSNRTRVFGWWKNLKQLCPIPPVPQPRLHPVTGEEMLHVGQQSLYSLDGTGMLGFIDSVRGKPVMATLTRQELAWLRSVQLPRPFG